MSNIYKHIHMCMCVGVCVIKGWNIVFKKMLITNMYFMRNTYIYENVNINKKNQN